MRATVLQMLCTMCSVDIVIVSVLGILWLYRFLWRYQPSPQVGWSVKRKVRHFVCCKAVNGCAVAKSDTVCRQVKLSHFWAVWLMHLIQFFCGMFPRVGYNVWKLPEFRSHHIPSSSRMCSSRCKWFTVQKLCVKWRICRGTISKLSN